MSVDRGFIERNRASLKRMYDLANRLTDDELAHPVGEHWTVAIAFAHLTFWDRRALLTLNATEQEGKLVAKDIDIVVNDISLPLWAVIPPRHAVNIALETAETLDHRLENYSADLLEVIHEYYPRWVERSAHRNTHLDEVEAALTQ